MLSFFAEKSTWEIHTESVVALLTFKTDTDTDNLSRDYVNIFSQCYLRANNSEKRHNLSHRFAYVKSYSSDFEF